MSVAIVMPYYNEKELLVKSVQAVFAQTYTDWCLFLIDDGSKPENSMVSVLSGFNLDYRKMCTMVKANGGVSTARNSALELIRHSNKFKYVAYCDSDDIWDVDYLEKQIQALSQGYDFVYSNVRHRFLDGSVAIPYGIADYPEYPGLQVLLKGNFIFVSGVIHRWECLQVGEFDNKVNGIEDWDYWCRIAENNFTFFKNPNACFTYTCKPDGNGSKGNKEVYERFYLKHGKYMVNA